MIFDTPHIIIILYSYLPALLLGAFFWWLDRFEREPWPYVLAAFLWGGTVAAFLSFVINTLLATVLSIWDKSGVASPMITAVLIAPLVEETCKGFFPLMQLRLGKLDNMTDGILLGVVVGLGFAASENVFYARQALASDGEIAMWSNLWFREIHTTLLHSSATAVCGAMAGYARFFTGPRRVFSLLNGLILAMVTHAFWNFMANFFSGFSGHVNFVGWAMRLELIVLFTLLTGLFFSSLAEQRAMIRRELEEEVAAGTFPPEHLDYFSALVRRSKQLAGKVRVTPQAYASYGVRLAFRKNEQRFLPSSLRAQEIEQLRQILKSLSGHEPNSLRLKYGE